MKNPKPKNSLDICQVGNNVLLAHFHSSNFGLIERVVYKMKLVCPAGSLPALKAAVDYGADAVYIGFNNQTNARNFPGLNFNEARAHEALKYAHAAGAKVYLALNLYPDFRKWPVARETVDKAAALGFDALIAADVGVLSYASQRYPELRLHLSVQSSATSSEAIALYQKQFGIRRAVLPRVLALPQVRRVVSTANVEIEVFGFGSLCVMVEGRCYLSSYVTGESPNIAGVCSPAKAVSWYERDGVRYSRLNNVLIDQYAVDEPAGYPTLCKGRFNVLGETRYALEQPTSLNTLDILPQLLAMGITAIKVEGRQRSPAYVAKVTKIMRQALDSCLADPAGYQPEPDWYVQLDQQAEGGRHTLGAYDRPWQ